MGSCFFHLDELQHSKTHINVDFLWESKLIYSRGWVTGT